MRTIILLLIVIVSSIASFGQQDSSKKITYFGGIYEETAYFNWVIQTSEPCVFIIEHSDDGVNYEVAGLKEGFPSKFPLLYGIKSDFCSTGCTWYRVIKVTKSMKEKITYEPYSLQENKYIRVSFKEAN